MTVLELAPPALLALLQHGDSQFPSGAFAFSGGLEGLLADGRLRAPDLPRAIAAWLALRWAPFDRVFVRRAWQAAGDCARLAALDERLDAMLLAPAERAGSCRAGAALLAAHVRLATPGAATLAANVAAGRLHGHRLVLEGALWRGAGLGETAAALLSAYGFVNALGTAAVRLGASGALAQQQLLGELREDMAALAAAPLEDADEPAAFNPWAEIALLRQARRDHALFAT